MSDNTSSNNATDPSLNPAGPDSPYQGVTVRHHVITIYAQTADNGEPTISSAERLDFHARNFYGKSFKNLVTRITADSAGAKFYIDDVRIAQDHTANICSYGPETEDTAAERQHAINLMSEITGIPEADIQAHLSVHPRRIDLIATDGPGGKHWSIEPRDWAATTKQ